MARDCTQASHHTSGVLDGIDYGGGGCWPSSYFADDDATAAPTAATHAWTSTGKVGALALTNESVNYHVTDASDAGHFGGGPRRGGH